MIKDEFSLVFQSFGSLKRIWAGGGFGLYGQSFDVGSRPEPHYILPKILARSAPRLAFLTIGPESSTAKCFRPKKDENGTVVGLTKLRNVPRGPARSEPFQAPVYGRVMRVSNLVSF